MKVEEKLRAAALAWRSLNSAIATIQRLRAYTGRLSDGMKADLRRAEEVEARARQTLNEVLW